MEEIDKVVKRALEQLGIEVFDTSTDGVSLISVLFRVKDTAGWLVIVDAILQEEERGEGNPPWSVHVCKRYLRHEGKLRFGWNLSLQLNNDNALTDFCRLINIMARHSTNTTPAPAAKKKEKEKSPKRSGVGGVVEGGEVVEMPLVGATENRNSLRKGKGASLLLDK